MLAESQLLLNGLDYPPFPSSLPDKEIQEGKYLIRFVKSREELDEALKLRFEVFNLELGEGLESSFLTGRDMDEYDLACHHLIIVESRSDKIVGTYRLQTGVMAATSKGFYSAREFDLSHLPMEMLEDSVELGRACIARSHRNTQALYLLWKGLAAYLAFNRKRYLFGCCSLTSQNPREGRLIMDSLICEGYLHTHFKVAPRPGAQCFSPDYSVDEDLEVKLPRLFKTYLRFGAKVCGPPAIDRDFKTIDFFVVFDVFQMDNQTHRMFFGAF
jgi:putative hemolysin